jgi:ketosteroid isomerase-like protein
MLQPTGSEPTSPEQRLREFWALFDVKDYQALMAMMTDDAMETDDFSKVWLHGPASIGENFARIGERYEDSHTDVRDVVVTTQTATTALVTCVVHYQMVWDGQLITVDAPTTIAFIRHSGVWRIALLHTR